MLSPLQIDMKYPPCLLEDMNVQEIDFQKTRVEDTTLNNWLITPSVTSIHQAQVLSHFVYEYIPKQTQKADVHQTFSWFEFLPLQHGRWQLMDISLGVLSLIFLGTKYSDKNLIIESRKQYSRLVWKVSMLRRNSEDIIAVAAVLRPHQSIDPRLLCLIRTLALYDGCGRRKAIFMAEREWRDMAPREELFEQILDISLTLPIVQEYRDRIQYYAVYSPTKLWKFCTYFSQWNFANQLVYNPCPTMIKLSILLFLRRLESKSLVVNILIWGSMAITVGLFLAVLFVDIFQCHPLEYVYNMFIQGGTCIQQGLFYVATAALNLFTDLLVLSILIIITWSLHMPTQRKIAVCLIPCLGAVATAVGVWRVILLAQAFFPTKVDKDCTYSIGFCSSAVEVNVAVITACAPSTRAIISKYIPKMWGSSKDTSKYPSNDWTNRYRSGLGYSRNKSLRGGDDGFEMRDPYGTKSKVMTTEHEVRGYQKGPDSLSSDEGMTGIVQTIDVSVRYTEGEEGTNCIAPSRNGKMGSIDSLV